MPIRTYHFQSQDARKAGVPPDLPDRAQRAGYRWALKSASIPFRTLLEQVWTCGFLAGWNAHRRICPPNQPATKSSNTPSG